MKLRRFNDEGMERFSDLLSSLRDGSTASPDFSLLENDRLTREIPSGPTLSLENIDTKSGAAELLRSTLRPLEIPDLMNDRGLWSWLALFHFDSLCPPSPAGRRKVRADAHYILNLDFRRVYRHLLRTPYHIAEVIPKFNRIFLEQPVSVHGELIEQIVGGRLYVIRIPSVAETVDRLYFDESTGKPKRGFTAESRRGNLRTRLPIRIQQLSMTYDIAGMSASHLLKMLGDEFNGWLSTSAG